jgi:hypothetical protein
MKLFRIFKTISTPKSSGILAATPSKSVLKNTMVICDRGSGYIVDKSPCESKFLVKLTTGELIIRPLEALYDIGVYIDCKFKKLAKHQYKGLHLNVGDLIDFSIVDDTHIKIVSLDSHPKQLIRRYSPDGSLEKDLLSHNIILVKLS